MISKYEQKTVFIFLLFNTQNIMKLPVYHVGIIVKLILSFRLCQQMWSRSYVLKGRKPNQKTVYQMRKSTFCGSLVLQLIEYFLCSTSF
jgi:hypothetical protein